MVIDHKEKRLFCKKIQKPIIYSYDINAIVSANRGIITTNKINVSCSGIRECDKQNCIRRNPCGKEDYVEN